MSEQCSEHVYRDSWGGSQCHRRGVVFEDGKWWCKQHSKAATQARRAKSEQRYAEESAQRTARWDAEAEQKRRADCFPALLAHLHELAATARETLKCFQAEYEARDDYWPEPFIWLRIRMKDAVAAIKEAQPEGEGK